MSIIVRLQNLPLSAKSGDIRRFFGGLRIPNGGVHIVGGEKGEAFIEFMSSDEARKAMKEDGGTIKNCKIRLFPSTVSEMHHEIAQITGDLSFGDSYERSPKEKSRSPHVYSEHSSEGRKRFTKEYRSDSSSRTGVIPKNSRSFTRQSRSDRSRRSRSPRKSRSPRRSRSPRGYKSRRSRSPRNRSRSPRRSSRSARRNSQSPLSEISSAGSPRALSPYKSGYLEASNLSADPSQRNAVSLEQAQLERKITEALERGYALDTPVVPQDPYPPAVTNQQFFNPVVSAPLVQNYEQFPNHNMNLPFPGPDYQVTQPQYPEINVLNNSIPQYLHQGNNFQPGFMPQNNYPSLAPNPVGLPPPNPMALPEMMPPLTMPPPPIPHSQAQPVINVPHLNTQMPVPVATMPPPVQVDAGIADGQGIPRGFYITLSGLDPHWNSEDVQNMLRGLFVPLNHIQFEQNDQGLKTGTVYVKLSNEDDFCAALSNRTYIFMSKIVAISETPDRIYQRYFLPDWSVQDPKSVNLYYKLKGLPYYATVESMITFFKGLQLADLYIERTPFGKASGICWVSFKTTQDYHDAFKLDGAPLGHRVVHLKHTTKEEMIKKKRRNGDLLSLSREKSSASTSIPLETHFTKPVSRSLCAMLTGLPSDVTPRKVAKFFKESGLEPDAIHVTLNNKNRPCGQAFVEFSSIRDFDSAVLCHGKKIDTNIICVKQVLYEEMSKVLSVKRSMHTYGQNGKNPAPFNLPEKVPYLWQPPDGNQDPYSQHFDEDNKYKPNRPDVKFFDYGNRSNQQQAELENSKLGQGIPVLHDRETNNSKKPFQTNNPSNLTMVTINNKRKRVRVRSRTRPKNKHEEREKHKVVELKKDDSVSKNNANQPSVQKKTDKVSVKVEPKETDTKKESSEKNDKPSHNTKVQDANRKEPKPVSIKSEKKLDETENTQHGSKEKVLPSTSAEKNKKPFVRQPDRYDKKNEGSRRVENHSRNYDMQRQRTYSPPSRHDDYVPPNPYLSGAGDYVSPSPAVVQICNVHPSMGSQEIKRFLQGFRIDGEQIVRGYSDNQEPTGDVRVTFRTIHEAKLAIRNLNNQLLEGIPVTLFLV